MDLSNLDMISIDFTGSNLRNVNFSGSAFLYVTFNNSNIEGADFTNATFGEDVNFNDTNFQSGQFVGLETRRAPLFVKNSSFLNADFWKAEISDIVFEEVDFSNTDLRFACLNKMTFNNFNFSKTKLSGLAFNYSKFVKCNFDNVEVGAENQMLAYENEFDQDTLSTIKNEHFLTLIKRNYFSNKFI